MSISIPELVQRLHGAVDSSFNVVDNVMVFNVVTELEGRQLTKEQLETTRLGKLVNDIRRSSNDTTLSRRLKSLLKRWRILLGVDQPRQAQQRPPTQPPTQPQQQPQQQNLPRVSPALAQQNDDRDVQQQYYSQNRGSTQVMDRATGKRSSSDKQRYGYANTRQPADSGVSVNSNQDYSNVSKTTKSNYFFPPPSDEMNVAAPPITPMDVTAISPPNSKSHISISALPKIPKIKNSATPQRLSRHTDRSHSPLINIRESSMPSPSQLTSSKFSSLAHDEDSVNAYDVQRDNRYLPSTSAMVNGRNQGYGENSNAIDNNSNSSTVNIIEPETPNILQANSESSTNEVLKKKHKKHKKEKKAKKHKRSMSPTIADRSSIPSRQPPIEMHDSLSSNSMSLFANSDSIRDQHMSTNNSAYMQNVGTSLPPTSSNHASKWTPAFGSNTVSSDDLTFSGRFKKTDDNIINIDSSSGSNSPKYRSKSPMLTARSHSSSPSRMIAMPTRGADFGSRIGTDEENSSTQHISLLNQNELSQASHYGDNLVADDVLAIEIPRASISSVAPIDEQRPNKKRGRKKGSKGVDSRLGSASNSSQSQQAGAPYYDSVSFSSLKNKIELIRGTTKKVKTTKELLAELQNRRATTSIEDASTIESHLQSHQDIDEHSLTNGRYNSGLQTTSPSPAQSPHTRLTTSERSSSKKSKSAAKEGYTSDNHSSYENQAEIESLNVKSLIDQQIEELEAKIPPINMDALREYEKLNNNDGVVCTCKLIETTEAENALETNDNATTKDLSVDTNVPKMLTDCNVLPQADTIDNRSHELNDNRTQFSKSIPNVEYNSTVATSTSTNIPNIKSASESLETKDPPFKKPIVKSIFDLDYDDDDPITFKLNHNNNINLNTNLNKLSRNSDSNNDISDDKSCDESFLNENIKNDGEVIPINYAANNDFHTHNEQREHEKQSDLYNCDPTSINAANANVNLSMQEEPKPLNSDLNAVEPPPRFRVEEDENCTAKKLYITSKQSITEYHIKNLHTSYIPNINGNWDEDKGDDESIKPETAIGCDEEQIAQTNIESTTMETTAPTTSDEINPDDEEDFEIEPRITEASVGLYERVVPLCNFLTMDHLPKSLSLSDLNFGPSDEVEPHVFLASITEKPAEVVNETESVDTIKVENTIQTNDDNQPEIVADDSFDARINQNFRIYGCSNDIDDIESERKHYPDIGLMDLDQRCEDIPADFECEPIEHMSDMEVDNIVMNDVDQLKSDTEPVLFPITNDPFVEPIESKNDNFNEESDIELHNESEPAKSPVIDEYARASTDDSENLHQVINLSPRQILPESDENAMDSMDFDTSYSSKPFDMAMEPGLEVYQNDGDEERQSIENIEAELDPHINSVSEMSDGSDDEGTYDADDNDDTEDDLSFENYEKNSNDHFITLENFDKELKDSSSEYNDSSSSDDGSSNSSDNSDDEEDKKATMADKILEKMICDDDEEYDAAPVNLSDNDTDEERPGHLTLFCKPIFGDDKSSNLLNENSNSHIDSNSDTNDSKSMVSVHSESSNHGNNSDNGKDPTKPRVHQKLTRDALKAHQALSSLHEKNIQKRLRSPSSTTFSSTDSSSDSSSSSNSSNSKNSEQHYKKKKRSKKAKRRKTEIQLPSYQFTNSDATKPPADSVSRYLNESPADSHGISNPYIFLNTSSNEDHAQAPIIETDQVQEQLPTQSYHNEQIRTNKIDVESSPPSEPKLIHDEPIQSSACYIDTNNDDLFSQNPLPEQLLQCEEKDDDGDSNNMDTVQKSQDDLLKAAIGECSYKREKENIETESTLSSENNGMLPSFNDLNEENKTGVSENGYKFKEWYEVVRVKSYNDELLTILPYVVID